MTTVRHALLWAYAGALVACTDPIERPPLLRVSIDADPVVRRDTVRVEITLEARNEAANGDSSKTWDAIFDRSFEPDPASDDDWPWQTTLEPDSSNYDHYKLTATARDAQRVVVGRAQAIRTRTEARRHDLRLRFDTLCYRPPDLCDEQYTCTRGVCVDATWIPNEEDQVAPDDELAPTTPGDPSSGVAMEGDACMDGARACSDVGSRTPLRCEQGSWRTQADCGETERCSTADDADLGTCKPIASKCMNREPGVPFCDGDTMLECPDSLRAVVRACAENERCTPSGATVGCGCRMGFVRGATGSCKPATECALGSGGCDELTQCSMQNDKPVCSACPSGYTGTGEQGCAPLLGRLEPSVGTLEPVVTPEGREYRVRVPFVSPQVTLTPAVPAGSTVTFNALPLGEDGRWTAKNLPLGETKVQLVVASRTGVMTEYTITLERMGGQQAYLKGTNTGTYDQFGSSADVSGDTLVVTAWFEDSGSTGVNSDPNNNDATDSGAAYVYLRERDGWKQQAYIKPSDTQAYDYFGTSVELEGDTLIVGSLREGLFETSIGASRPGSAYVFTRTGGEWKQVQLLSGSSPSSSADMFGSSLVLVGDTLAIGAPADSTGGQLSGAVYILERDGAMFKEVQKIYSSKPAAQARFGAAIALEGDRLVVGSPDGPPPHNRPGTAEVFVRRDGTWTSSQHLQPQNLGGAANFGYSIVLRGDRMMISAPSTSAYPGSPTPTRPGEVYVFEAEAGTWTQTARLRAIRPRDTDWFGMSIAMLGETLVIGAPGDASGARGIGSDPMRSDAVFSGAVYLFTTTADGTWMPSTYIKADNASTDSWFGRWVTGDGDTLAITAMFEDSGGSGVPSGAAYVYR